MVTVAGLLLGGCGNDDATVVILKPSGKYLYVDNDATVNAVSGFAIQKDGTLVELEGSPYATGGAATGGYFAANRIALARGKNLLFVSNVVDSTISVFKVNQLKGTLTQIGVPVASGGTMGSSGSLAVSDNGKFLFAANDGTGDISSFAIASSGELTPVTGSPFAIGTDANGINLNLTGNVLYVANGGTASLTALSVAADGSLSPIAGSPFAYTAGGTITSFVLGSSSMGFTGATGGVLSSYSIDATGAPTLLNTLATGGSGQAVTTTRKGGLAILSGGFGSEIIVANVAADGTLTQVAGSPFPTAAQTRGYAVANPKGTFLYASESDRIEGFSIDADGVLTSLGTFLLTNPGGARSLTIY
jgi:6-phosphogluconolactonase